MKPEENLVEIVLEDFRKRQNDRKQFEAIWQLSMNFFMGNQYCSISQNSEIEEYEKQYFWQERSLQSYCTHFGYKICKTPKG